MARNLLPLLGALTLASCGPSAPNAAAVAPLGPPVQLPSQPQQPQGTVFSGPGRHLFCDGELEPAVRTDHHLSYVPLI